MCVCVCVCVSRAVIDKKIRHLIVVRKILEKKLKEYLGIYDVHTLIFLGIYDVHTLIF